MATSPSHHRAQQNLLLVSRPYQKGAANLVELEYVGSSLKLVSPSNSLVFEHGRSKNKIKPLLPKTWSLDSKTWFTNSDRFLDALLHQYPELKEQELLGSSYIYLGFLANSLYSACEAARLLTDKTPIPSLHIPIDPDEVPVLTGFDYGDALSIAMFALIPGAQLFNRWTEDPLSANADIKIKLSRSMVGLHGSPLYRDRSRTYAFPATVRSWPTGLSPDEAGNWDELSEGLWDFDRAPIFVLNVGELEQIQSIKGQKAREDAIQELFLKFTYELLVPVIKKCNMLTELSVKLLNPQSIWVSDHLLPESVAAVLSAPEGSEVLVLPHSTKALMTPLWKKIAKYSKAKISPVVPSSRMIGAWRDAGFDPVLDLEMTTFGDQLLECTKSNPIKGNCVRVFYVGGGYSEVDYPRIPFESLDSILEVLFSPPESSDYSVIFGAKPRPHWDTPKSFDYRTKRIEIVNNETKLSKVFSQVNIAVFIEISSQAIIEAAANGAIPIVLTTSTVPNWRDRQDDAHEYCNLDDLLVINYRDFWDWLEAAMSDRNMLENTWRRIRDSLLSDFSTENDAAS